MRLTAELIKDSLSYLNPLKERELDLRARIDSEAPSPGACETGHRIPAIENLGAAGPHDSIDFTDNDIQTLGNFPLSPRITTLLLARNRVASIQPALPTAIPNLRHLVLASNQIAELADLDVLVLHVAAGLPVELGLVMGFIGEVLDEHLLRPVSS
ncbi:hypothetical protein BN1708_003001 [Verticillium longisporum]|uniref:U2 small nuclear ribonucleoprotein A' n=1 Tax=Verticillium longisporum TaxID=100787 RepID=A0A0G4L6W0_VERLO|nr:hypothetical protein BN1708_003001 [Verticillium longisporum]